MNAPATLATPPDTSADDPAEASARALRERQIGRLDRMAEAGMEMIEALVAQARGSGPKVVDGDVGLAFSRVSRAVRLSILLQNELAGRPDGPGADSEGEGAPDEGRRRKDHADRAVQIVKRVARDHCEQPPYEVKAVVEEAAERLQNDDIYGLVASRPVGELVAMICEDLGLEPDWDALAAEAWAQAEIESGAKGSPFLDDDLSEDDEPEVPAPKAGPARTYEETLAALARDPAILAAARRDTG